MKYVYLVDGKAYEIIPEEDPVVPGVSIEQRYSKSFLDSCVAVADDAPVRQGMLYEDGGFVEPPKLEPELAEEPGNPGIAEKLLAAGTITAEEYTQLTGKAV